MIRAFVARYRVLLLFDPGEKAAFKILYKFIKGCMRFPQGVLRWRIRPSSLYCPNLKQVKQSQTLSD